MKVFVARKKYLCLLVEIVVLLIFSCLSGIAYTEQEFTFKVDDMCLQDINHNYSGGGILTLLVQI